MQRVDDLVVPHTRREVEFQLRRDALQRHREVRLAGQYARTHGAAAVDAARTRKHFRKPVRHTTGELPMFPGTAFGELSLHIVVDGRNLPYGVEKRPSRLSQRLALVRLFQRTHHVRHRASGDPP